MKIVIAPDSFKESLSALEAAAAIERGFKQVYPEAVYVKAPMADGGEGTVEALVAATGGQVCKVSVCGPLGTPVEAFFGLTGGLTGDGGAAVIEMAAASGLMLLKPDQRNPLVTTTYGVGELIRAALDRGARRLIIGVGGSATNDAGAGMLLALGVRLLDRDGQPIGSGGGELDKIARVDSSGLDPRIKDCRIEVACDVNNPLVGPTGASVVFGPQKGATPEMVRRLDGNLRHFAECVLHDLGVAIADLPGGGAAGGLGAALHGVLGARLRPGVEIVMEAMDLDRLVADADLVVTGEGRIDGQTIYGKTPIGVAALAKRHGKPVIGIAGSQGPGVEAVFDRGIDAVFDGLSHLGPLEDALAEAAQTIQAAARNVAAAVRIGMTLCESPLLVRHSRAEACESTLETREPSRPDLDASP